jgi:hypothetical protein
VKENVMTTNRVRLFGGAILTGALLLGTAGLALAQGPTASSGIDRMGSGGMMGGQGVTGSGGMTGGSGMMDSQAMTGAMSTMHASMTADQLKAMGTMHASMATSGTYDPSGH